MYSFSNQTEMQSNYMQKRTCETKQTLFQAGSHQDVSNLMSFDVICGQAVPPFMALSGALPAMFNDNSSAFQPGRATLGSMAMTRVCQNMNKL